MISLPTNRLPTEHEEQRDFVSWWRKCGLPMIYAIPNGGGRSKTQALKLQCEGVLPGIPDLHCPELRLWIEMKRQKKGAVSVEQKTKIAYLRRFDFVSIAKGCTDAKRQTIDFLEKNRPDLLPLISGLGRVAE